MKQTDVDHTSEDGMEELRKEVVAARESSTDINPKDKIFLCIAWSNIEELRLFKKFPSLLYCDATGDTNNNKNHLVTFSGRSPDGQQFIFLRVWVRRSCRMSVGQGNDGSCKKIRGS